MSAETGYLIALTVVVLLMLGALILLGRAKTSNTRAQATIERLTDEKDRHQTLVDRVRQVVVNDSRYAIEIADWGPDFTGEDGTLPRFRWTIRRANYRYRKVLGLVTPEDPGFVMVGNESTLAEAYIAALLWVERQQHPAQAVVVER